MTMQAGIDATESQLNEITTLLKQKHYPFGHTIQQLSAQD